MSELTYLWGIELLRLRFRTYTSTTIMAIIISRLITTVMAIITPETRPHGTLSVLAVHNNTLCNVRVIWNVNMWIFETIDYSNWYTFSGTFPIMADKTAGQNLLPPQRKLTYPIFICMFFYGSLTLFEILYRTWVGNVISWETVSCCSSEMLHFHRGLKCESCHSLLMPASDLRIS